MEKSMLWKTLHGNPSNTIIPIQPPPIFEPSINICPWLKNIDLSHLTPDKMRTILLNINRCGCVKSVCHAHSCPVLKEARLQID
jgi:hypothetical protein